MRNIIQGVKGARDFYPEAMHIRNYLLKHIREVSQLFGYQEYDGPFLEKIQLYAAKSGEELVKEQSFVFPDRGGELITLRPELTPSLARMIAEKQNELAYPLRWWSFGPFWRYEKPQKGRTREFFQWNIDLIGVNSVFADAEMLCICAEFFKSLDLEPAQVKIFVNDRKLMDTVLSEIGINEDQKQKVIKLIDRIDKLPAEVWGSLLLELGITQLQLGKIKSLLHDTNLWQKSIELTQIFEILKVMKADRFVEFNPRIIRGLDYYTGIVFEAWDVGGDGRAVLGGGHYDNLVSDVGGDPLPGVGFAMGDVMISILLEKYGKIQKVLQSDIQVLITLFDESTSKFSYKLLSELHKAGIKSVVFPQASKLQKQFKFADKLGIPFVIIAGPSEIESGNVALKILKDGSQKEVPISQIIEVVSSMIAL